MAITTLQKVKTILQITDNSKDALITELIPLVEEDYQVLRRKPFDKDTDGSTVYPMGAELTAIRMVEYNMANKSSGVKSESISRYSVTYEDAEKSYPKSIIGKIKRCVSFI